MKRFKSTLGIILAIVMVSMTIFPATVAHAAGTMAFSVGTDYGGFLASILRPMLRMQEICTQLLDIIPMLLLHLQYRS